MKTQKILQITGTGLLCLGLLVGPVNVAHASTNAANERVAGGDRIETARLITERACQNGCEEVALVNAYAPADALTVSGTQGDKRRALLLVDPNPAASSHAQLRATIAQIGAAKVRIYGGEGIFPQRMVQALGLPADTERVGGVRRAATAIAAAQKDYPDGAQTAVLTTGGSGAKVAADAIGAAALHQGPILLTEADGSLAADTLAEIARLEVEKLIIVGGPAAISADVEAQLAQAVPGMEIQRIGGNTRVDTSYQLSISVNRGQGSVKSIYVVKAQNPVDALAASALQDGPVLLQDLDAAPNGYVTQWANNWGANIVALGGPGTPEIPFRSGAYLPQVDGARRLGVPYIGQINGFYCGPAAVQQVLSKLGAYYAAGSGQSLSQGALAQDAYLRTNTHHRETRGHHGTDWNDGSLSRGLNRWLGANVYQQLSAPTDQQFQQAVFDSLANGYPVVVDTIETWAGPHYNGHRGSSSHIVVVDGYDPATGLATFVDPGASLGSYSRAPYFTYPLATFAGHFLQGAHGMVWVPRS